MENRSEIRRLDDAGRLIIPKAMRKILRWYSGDPILLTLHSRDSLLLHSYPRMLALRPLAADYADAFFATYQTPIAICDHERILVHRGFPLAGQPEPCWNATVQVPRNSRLFACKMAAKRMPLHSSPSNRGIRPSAASCWAAVISTRKILLSGPANCWPE